MKTGLLGYFNWSRYWMYSVIFSRISGAKTNNNAMETAAVSFDERETCHFLF